MVLGLGVRSVVVLSRTGGVEGPVGVGRRFGGGVGARRGHWNGMERVERRE